MELVVDEVEIHWLFTQLFCLSLMIEKFEGFSPLEMCNDGRLEKMYGRKWGLF